MNQDKSTFVLDRVMWLLVAVAIVFFSVSWGRRHLSAKGVLSESNAVIESVEAESVGARRMRFRLKVMPMNRPAFVAYLSRAVPDGMADFQPGSVRVVVYDERTQEVRALK